MQRNHLSHCLIGVAAAVVLLLAAGVQLGSLLVLGAALACPLMMFFMMRGMMGGSGHAGHDDHANQRRAGDRPTGSERSL